VNGNNAAVAFPASRQIRFGWADLLGPAAGGTVIAVVCMWLLNQGGASLASGEKILGSLGLLTGLLAADLMLLQVVLMARIPWIERAWGHDLLARRHRLMGFASFWFMVAHIALFLAERLSRSGVTAAAVLWALFVADPWMLLASAGTVLLILVVASSIRAARRRLRYESWHLLHLYAYLGIGFALPHQLAMGADFHTTVAQIYWWTLYLAATAAVLACRVGLPLWRSLYHGTRVAEVRTESACAVSVIVRGRRLERLRTRSGQFFIWRFLDGPGWTRGNPYTLSAPPEPDQMRITIQTAGDGSARAATLQPGTRVLFEGPYGTLTTLRRRHALLALVAGGVGITPIRALLEDARYEPGDTVLVYRYSREEHALFKAEIDEIAARRGVMVHYLPGARRTESSWIPEGAGDDDTDALTALIPDLATRDLFVCGPPGWITAVRTAALRAGVLRKQIHTEEFGR